MSDHVVYDIVEAGPTWWFAVAGLVPAVLFPPVLPVAAGRKAAQEAALVLLG